MAGIEGFEPSHAGVKVLSLTAWLYPYIKLPNDYITNNSFCQEK